MRHVGLLAFGITTAVLVPAAVQRLTAGPTQLAKLVAPGAKSLTIDGTKIDISLDRALLDPGDKVTLKLHAHDSTAKRVTVGVLVLGSTGSEGDRVPSPPVGVAHKNVTLDIGPDGTATKEVAFTLTGARNRGYEPFSHYKLMVMAPKAASRLETLRGNAHLVGDSEEGIPWYNKSGDRFMSLYWSVNSHETPDNSDGTNAADAKLYDKDSVAIVEAHTRPKSSAITIAAPDTARTGEVFTVAVTVKNPTKRKLTGLEISLDNPSGLLDDQYLGMSDKAVVISDDSKVDLAAGATKRVEFKVTASATGVVGLYARATCDECNDNDVLGKGAFEAVEIGESAPLVGQR
jgi:hypothetical protein